MDTPQSSNTSPIGFRATLSATLILLVSFLLFAFASTLQGNLGSVLSEPIAWFSRLDPSTSLDIVSTAAELLAAILAIAITVVAIIVELAANRYSHRITSLFLREPINIMVMCFFVVATLYSVWIALTLDAAVESAMIINAGLMISLVVLTLSLVILLPYFAYVMSFLSPVNVINKIKISAVKASKITNKNVAESKLEFLKAVDELQDIARRASELTDRAVEMASINSFLDLALEYQKQLPTLVKQHPAWFEIDETIQNDPDFVSINESSLRKIGTDKLWVEVKIVRQYLDFISDSTLSSRDTSYLIAINTRKIAIASLDSRPDLELVDLTTKCFNSYLRANIKDPRTGYYVMNQYRMLEEHLLECKRYAAVFELASHLQFYGLLGFKQGIPFLLEVVAEDVAEIAANCIGKDSELLNNLVSLTLDLDQEIKEENQEDSLLGVRRAQVKLAVKLLAQGHQELANKIIEDLKTEDPSRLQNIVAMLTSEDRSEYWEFTDRGDNFSYIDPELRGNLDSLLKSIHSL